MSIADRLETLINDNYDTGYKSCLKDLKKWLLNDNTDEHVSSVYKFIEEMEKK